MRVLAVEGFGAGDNDEEPDHTRRNSADDDVDALELPVARLQLLVDGIGLDEGQPPGCERGAESRGGHKDGVTLKRKPLPVAQPRRTVRS